MTERGLTKNEIITELTRSTHAKLKDVEKLKAYVPVGAAAAKQEPEFMAHLIAWNEKKGQVRDSKVALPVVSLSVKEFTQEADLRENSLAHIGLLGPREMLKAVQFSWKTFGRNRTEKIREVVERYLRSIEEPWRKFDRTAILHRHTLKSLYATLHIKPSTRADRVVMKGENPDGSVYAAVRDLAKLPASEAALTLIKYRIPFLIAQLPASEAALAMIKYRIPFLIAQGALGKRLKDEPELVLALIEKMSPTEPKALEKSGQVELSQKLHGAQEKQLQSMGVEGNWLVLGDRSPSMQNSVEIAKKVAGTLAAMVKGKVWLVFFDSTPQAIDVTGSSLDIIEKSTRHIRAGGSGTSIGCGLQRMLDEKQEFDGIAIVSDGEENSTPYFADAYKRYAKFVDKEVPVYFYHTSGGRDRLIDAMKSAAIDMQTFDLTRGDVDYYSLPNLVTTMRTNRYSLIDEIMSTRLLTLDEVINVERKEEEADVLTAT